MSTICALSAIDVHGHFGQYARMGTHPLKERFMSGDPATVVATATVERILFGTDTPVYFVPSQRARIDHADLNDEQKHMILWNNAQRILPISDNS